MTAPWLRAILETRGITDRVGHTRRARATRCPSCRELILAGLNADIAALPVTVDTHPLSPLGEALALLTGRRTYELTITSARIEIDERDQFRIRGTRDPRRPVVAEHRCNAPPLPIDNETAHPLARATMRKAENANDEPPY